MNIRLGFMQGRLVRPEKLKTIQYFPAKNWKKEIILSNYLNLKLIEWTINIENIKSNPLYSYKKYKILKKFLKENPIDIQSVTCDFFMQKPFFKKEKNFSSIKILKKVILFTKKLGIKYIIIPLVDNSKIENKYQEENLINVMKNLSKLLGKSQKFLFEIDYSPTQTLKFIKRFNSKFGINYDTGNSACLGHDFQKEKLYFKYVYNIHLKDRLYKGKTVRLGKGDFDFKRFFNYLKKINYSNNLILQTARSFNDIKEMEININYIKKFL